jgi:hypothetical protein
MKLRTLLLTSILTLGILTTSLTAQIVEDNRERETITSVGSNGNAFGMVHTIEDTYYLKYKDTKYSYLKSYNEITIGDLESYRAFRKIVLEFYNNPKRNGIKRFSLNGVDFVLSTFSKKSIRIFINYKGIETGMGYWSIKKINKLLPKID